MARIIDISVAHSNIKLSSDLAGVEGEANSTDVAIRFGADWTDMPKRLIWANARAENPVSVLLGPAELRDDGSYLTCVPTEALEYRGWCVMTVQAYDAEAPTRILRSAMARLKVEDNWIKDDISGAVTPTVAEQLLSEMNYLNGFQERAENAAEASERSASDSAASAALSQQNAYKAATSASAAAESAVKAAESEQAVNETVLKPYKGIIVLATSRPRRYKVWFEDLGDVNDPDDSGGVMLLTAPLGSSGSEYTVESDGTEEDWTNAAADGENVTIT